MAPEYHHGFHGYIVPVPLPHYTIMVFMVILYHGPLIPSWCSWLYHTMAPVYHHGVHGYIILWPKYTIMMFIVSGISYYYYGPVNQRCRAEIIYFRLRLQLRLQSQPCIGTLKMGNYVFQQHKNYIYYKSNIIKGISERWLEVSLFSFWHPPI